VDEDEEGKLALWGEGGFGFVEEEEAVASELVLEEGEEGFAVRASVEALSSVGGQDWWAESFVFNRIVKFVDVRSSVEEAFGAKEEAGAGALVEGEAQGSHEVVGGVVVFCGVVADAAVAAFGAKAVVGGDGFEECRFAGSVFSDEEGDAGVDRDLGQGGDGGDGEGVDGPVFYSFAQEGDLFQHEIGSELGSFSITCDLFSEGASIDGLWRFL
jgi:hypothetical protein